MEPIRRSYEGILPGRPGAMSIIRERIDKLPGGPSCRGMVDDVEMEEFAPFMPEDDEDEEEAEGKGRDDEEVDGDERRGRAW